MTFAEDQIIQKTLSSEYFDIVSLFFNGKYVWGGYVGMFSLGRTKSYSSDALCLVSLSDWF